jgi:hypothetical protein
MRRFRHRHRWLAFIDADEFIVLQEPQYARPSWEQQQQQQQRGGHAGGSNTGSSTVQDINTFLQQYEQYGGLGVNWVIFGSSGHTKRPQGGVLVNYHACLPAQQEQNTHVKIIANTKYLLTMGDDPHRVYYKDDKHWTVNELGTQVRPIPLRSEEHTPCTPNLEALGVVSA